MPPIPPHDTDVVDQSWDAAPVLKALPAENQRRWKTVFAWYDASAANNDGDGLPDAKGAWKFPHHTRVGGPAVVAALRNGLSRLGRANIPADDRAGVRRHLQRHLDAFNSRAQLPRFRCAPGAFELRAKAGDGMPTLAGHFAVWDQWTEIDSLFEGRFMERILPGAFKKTIEEGRNRIKVLFQHGRDPQVGDKPLGPIDQLREDDTGVYYEVPLLDTTYNRDLIPGLEAGLYGASFRFSVVQEELDQEPKPHKGNPDGLPERTIAEVRLSEFGPVTFPAYATATAGVRSTTDRFAGATTAPAPALPDDGAGADDVGHHSDDESRPHGNDGAGRDHSALIRISLALIEQ